ncbi:hypothetical protein EBR96_04600 [bacterium]|nr:hypothetical protein [bacterium]
MKLFGKQLTALGRWLLIFILIGLVAGLSGCAISVRESTTYSVPNWTYDGRIVARRTYMKHETTWVSNSNLVAYQNAIVVLNPDGTNEQKLFDVDENAIQFLEISPSGNYLAYMASNDLMKVFRFENGRWNLKWTKTMDRIMEVKFSPDETMIYASIGRSEFFIYDANGNLIRQNSSGGGGVWKNSNQILYSDFILKSIVLMNVDDGTKIMLSDAIYPEVYLPSSNKIASTSGSFFDGYKLRIQSLDNFSIVTTNFTYAGYDYGDFIGRHFSPDGTKMVMMYNSVEDVGIYVLDFNTSELSQIR